MRIRNLQHLRIDQHLGWSKKRLRIAIPPDEVKNNEHLDCLFVKHLECDEQTADLFHNVLTRVRPQRKGLSKKNRVSMQQFDDGAVVGRLLHVSDDLWALAQKEGPSKKGSLMAQSAVTLDILTYAPMRIRNLQHLRIDQHLGWSKKRLRIAIPPDEVKNNEHLDYLLPETVSTRIADTV